MILLYHTSLPFADFLGGKLSAQSYEVTACQAEQELTKLLQAQRYSVAIVAGDMRKIKPFHTLRLIKKAHATCEVVYLPEQGHISESVKLVRAGACDYIPRRDLDAEKFLLAVERAHELSENRQHYNWLHSQSKERNSFKRLIGKSKSFKQAVKLAQKVAVTDTSVLLMGETGTGKELFARSIHQSSQRSNKPYVAVNCSAISESLLESEMFGHVKGSFTDAKKDKRGFFEQADGGTIFLDEIGEMSLELQAKMLRVLENGEFYKIGSETPRKVDVRVISATNRNLEDEIEDGNFRSDLFFRLSVFQIKLPNLSQREEDIPLLARHFLEDFNQKIGRGIEDISPAFVKALRNHVWQGNIRELRNLIERAVILCDGNRLETEYLPIGFNLNPGGNGTMPKSMKLQDVESSHISYVIRHTGGNKSEAARLLNIGLATLYRKIKEYQIEV